MRPASSSAFGQERTSLTRPYPAQAARPSSHNGESLLTRVEPSAKGKCSQGLSVPVTVEGLSALLRKGEIMKAKVVGAVAAVLRKQEGRMRRSLTKANGPAIWALLAGLGLGASSALAKPCDLLRTFQKPTPAANDDLGCSVAAVGNNVLIGAYRDDAGASEAGAAYLFDGSTGALLRTFLNPTPAESAGFGCSVAAVGDNVLVGAYGADAGAERAGAAYLFDGSTGALLRTFLNPTPAAYDYFGNSVAAVGNNVLVAARCDDTGAANAGAAYLFDGSTGEVTILGRIYRGYNISPVGGLFGLLWGFVDGLVGGAIFAWLYNLLVGRRTAQN